VVKILLVLVKMKNKQTGALIDKILV